MADQARTLVVGHHEVIIRIRRTADGGADLAVEAPACHCEAAPSSRLIVAVVTGLEAALAAVTAEAEQYETEQASDLTPTQAPGEA